jgi:hypothetical protein
MGSSYCTVGTTVASGVGENPKGGDDRGIPPFKKRRVGHPGKGGPAPDTMLKVIHFDNFEYKELTRAVA